MTPALEASSIAVTRARDGARLVDGVDVRLDAGQVLGLAGESGSGKSLALSVMADLVPPGLQADGQVLVHGRLRGPGERRGAPVAVMFQDSQAVFHPALALGAQLLRVAQRHGVPDPRDACRRALAGVGLDDGVLGAFPHELSGGMLQRLQLAQALLPAPSILLADEPTTALDVSLQAVVLDLLARHRRASGLSVLLVSHDLGVVAGHADRVAVMYAGRIVEEGPTSAVLGEPAHPYTRALLRSRPPLPPAPPAHRLPVLDGAAPAPAAARVGCAFAPRCERASDTCRGASPVSSARAGSEGRVACHHPLGAGP